MGRMLKVWMDQPRYHTTEDGRWDYRVTIVFKNSAAANEPFEEDALKKRELEVRKQSRQQTGFLRRHQGVAWGDDGPPVRLACCTWHHTAMPELLGEIDLMGHVSRREECPHFVTEYQGQHRHRPA